jgi:hypothetical protein
MALRIAASRSLCGVSRRLSPAASAGKLFVWIVVNVFLNVNSQSKRKVEMEGGRGGGLAINRYYRMNEL